MNRNDIKNVNHENRKKKLFVKPVVRLFINSIKQIIRKNNIWLS